MTIESEYWRDVERYFGADDLGQIIEREIIPELEAVKQEKATKQGFPLRAVIPAVIGFFVAARANLFVSNVLPDNTFGEVLSFLLLPVVFVLVAIAGLYLCRGYIAQFFLDSQSRFMHRTAAMNRLAERLSLEYIPIPGGASQMLKTFANWKFSPQLLRDMVASMDDHGGFDDVAEIIRRSELAMPKDVYLGSAERREKYVELLVKAQQFEDGFKGVRDGIEFSALEWNETTGESHQHHFLLVLKLPTTLTGLVELKGKKQSWPLRAQRTDSREAKAVKLISKDFHKRFDVRAHDQMEARLVFDPAVIERLTTFAKGDAARAVAFDNILVFDIESHNQFNMVDLLTGEWSRHTIRSSLSDIANMLGLVSDVANAFSIRAERRA